MVTRRPVFGHWHGGINQDKEMSMKTIKTTLGIALFSCCAFSMGAHAADDAQKAQRKQIEANYDAAKDLCKPKSGNDKDVCQQQAKASYDNAMADSKANEKVNDARNDANKDKRDADYKVAKEKCDSLSGSAKDSCQDQAKATYGK
jgi:hypothetical protein